MKNKFLIFSCLVSTLMALSGHALAATISEVEANDTIATAQNIDASFTLDYSADIGDVSGTNTSTTIPHVTIQGTGNGTFDYYSFYVPFAGAIGIFDIDYGLNVGGSIDTELGLYDLAGNVLDENDDYSPYATVGAGGSIHHYDAFIQYTFSNAGTYVIGVGEYNTTANPGGLTGNVPDTGDTYTLQVSIEEDTAAGVPEPTSFAMLAGLGAMGLAFARRKKLA